jgi:hypothetical protein
MGYQSAMEAAGAEVLLFKQFGSYQGDWWAKVRFDGKEYWVHGSYGSCSGCDAFEAEFDYSEENCDEHRYEYGDVVATCEACATAKTAHVAKLAKFGHGYLVGNEYTQEEAEKSASENLEWDSDAQEMITFIRDNPIH